MVRVVIESDKPVRIAVSKSDGMARLINDVKKENGNGSNSKQDARTFTAQRLERNAARA